MTEKNTLFLFIKKYGFLLWSFVLTALVVFAFPWNRPESALIDDTYIVLRYAKNFADGLGLVFNPGEYVAGFTSTLHTLILSLPYVFDYDSLRFIQYFGAISIIFLGLAGYWISSKYNLEIPALAISAFAATHWAPMFFAGAGLETVFYAASLVAGVAAYLHGRLYASSFFLALAVLNRHEAALIWAILIVHDFLVHQSMARIRKLATPFLAALAILTAGLLTYYHDPLPLAFYNKISLSYYAFERGWGMFWNQSGYAGIRWVALSAMAIAIPAGLFYIMRLVSVFSPIEEPRLKLWSWLEKPSERVVDIFLLSSCVTVYVFYQCVVGGDWMGARFVTHWLVLACALGVYCVAWISLYTLKVIKQDRLRDIATLSIKIVAVVVIVFNIKLPEPSLKPMPEMAGLIEESRWLRDNAKEGSLLAACWGGVPAYFSELKTIDTWGRANTEIGKKKIHIHSRADLGVPGHEKQDNFWVISKKPDYILCSSPAADGHASGVAAPLDLVPFRNIFAYREWYDPAITFVTPDGRFEKVSYHEGLPQKVWDDIRKKYEQKITRDKKNPAALATLGHAINKRRETPNDEVIFNRFDFQSFSDDGPITSSKEGKLVTQPWFFEKGKYRLDFKLDGQSDTVVLHMKHANNKAPDIFREILQNTGKVEFEVTDEFAGQPVEIGFTKATIFTVNRMSLKRAGL